MTLVTTLLLWSCTRFKVLGVTPKHVMADMMITKATKTNSFEIFLFLDILTKATRNVSIVWQLLINSH